MKNSSLTSLSKSLPSFSMGKVGLFIGTAGLGQWVLSDVAHIPGGGMGLFIGGVAVWWVLKPNKAIFNAPVSVKGWIEKCKEVLEQFESLEDDQSNTLLKEKRSAQLESITGREGPLDVGLISTKGVVLPEKEKIEAAFSGSSLVKISFAPSLTVKDESWNLPINILEKDFLVYFLPLPLRAADLLWLKTIPTGQPSWIMVSWDDALTWPEEKKALEAQLPDRWNDRILRWSGSNKEMAKVLTPIRRLLDQPKKNLELTKQRLLERLFLSWQKDLEKLRREKFNVIQVRSQWIVAGVVFASPLPSTDLLSVAVVNGLMVKEMSEIWSCSIKPELLNAVAQQLALAAIAQGVVEWSGQSLLGMAKLHGSSWIAAGTIQALSAAYLTRVVGRSMADWMAINNGVSEPDLELIKQQAPQLVANAVEKEKVDWVGFINQSKHWIKDQTANRKLKMIS